MKKRTDPKHMSGPRATHVALLRGVNVGGKHMIPMAALASMFSGAGAEAVRTYIQSGNVLYAPGRLDAEAIARQVAARIKAEFGFESVIIVRSRADMARIAKSHPHDGGPGSGDLYVGFLDRTPRNADIASLDPMRSPGDLFQVRGREIYLRYSAARTRLTSAYLDSALKATCTVRNWRTVCALAEMIGGR